MKVGALRHTVTCEKPGPTVPDNEGGFTQAWATLTPAQWPCSIEPATMRDLERSAAGTVITTASHIITGRYHPQIDTTTRLTKGGRNAQGVLLPKSREFQVTGIRNLEEKNEVLQVLCEEVLGG